MAQKAIYVEDYNDIYDAAKGKGNFPQAVKDLAKTYGDGAYLLSTKGKSVVAKDDKGNVVKIAELSPNAYSNNVQAAAKSNRGNQTNLERILFKNKGDTGSGLGRGGAGTEGVMGIGRRIKEEDKQIFDEFLKPGTKVKY